MHKAVLPTVKPTIEKEGHKGSTDDDLEIDEDKPEDFDEGEDEDEEDEDEDDLDNEGLGGGLDGEDDLGTDLHSHKEKPGVDPTTTDDEDLESQCMAFLYIFIISRPFLFLFYPLDGGGRHKVDVGTENCLSKSRIAVVKEFVIYWLYTLSMLRLMDFLILRLRDQSL